MQLYLLLGLLGIQNEILECTPGDIIILFLQFSKGDTQVMLMYARTIQVFNHKEILYKIMQFRKVYHSSHSEYA